MDPDHTPRDERFLTEWLADRDQPCPVCGYNLRSCSLPKCPECGVPIRVSVTSEDPSPGGWLLAVISCTLAAGFDLIGSLIFVSMVTYFSIAETVPPPSARLMLIAMLASMLVPGVLCAVGLILLLRKRRTWRRLIPRSRWRRGFAVLVIVALPHILIGLFWFSRMIAQ